jgi:hypothetical protein
MKRGDVCGICTIWLKEKRNAFKTLLKNVKGKKSFRRSKNRPT